MTEQPKCAIEKTNSGIALTIIILIVSASLAGILGWGLQSYLGKKRETKLTMTIGDFYVRVHDDDDTFNLGYDYELGAIGLAFMGIDKNIWDEFLKYDNVSEYEKATNTTLSSLIGSFITIQYTIWGDLNGFMDFDKNITDEAKHGIDNQTEDFIWKDNYVIILSEVMLFIYNWTINGTTREVSYITPHEFDIMGSSFTEDDMDTIDIINMTKLFDPIAFHPSESHSIDILGIDYNAITHEATYLDCMLDGKQLTVTDRHGISLY